MYFAVVIEMPEEAMELVQALLEGTGSLGLEVADGSLKPPPGSPPLAPGRARIVAYYEGEAQAQGALQEIAREFPGARATIAPVRADDWRETWKKHVKATRVGRVWVGPSWLAGEAGDAPIRIVIEPGMAFGTGDHPTTALCLAELDRALSRRRGGSALDVGTGTGILAIAARRLGAARVVANDVDPAALRIARENAEANGIDGVDFTDRPVERIDGIFDVVVANIYANVLMQLAPRLCDRLAPGGAMILAGILAGQESEVAEAFEREGLKRPTRRYSGDWVLLALARPKPP